MTNLRKHNSVLQVVCSSGDPAEIWQSFLPLLIPPWNTHAYSPGKPYSGEMGSLWLHPHGYERLLQNSSIIFWRCSTWNTSGDSHKWARVGRKAQEVVQEDMSHMCLESCQDRDPWPLAALSRGRVQHRLWKSTGITTWSALCQAAHGKLHLGESQLLSC